MPVHATQIVPWGSNDALALVQRKLDVDILVSGHTHEFKVGGAAGGRQAGCRALMQPCWSGFCSALMRQESTYSREDHHAVVCMHEGG